MRRGPYRLLRHPSYAGIFIMFAGLGLAFGSWVGAAAALLIVFAGLLPRIRVEERANSEALRQMGEKVREVRLAAHAPRGR